MRGKTPMSLSLAGMVVKRFWSRRESDLMSMEVWLELLSGSLIELIERFSFMS